MTHPILAVIDTSVFVAGLMSRSATSAAVRVLDHWRAGRYTLVMAPALMRELVVTLRRHAVPDAAIIDLVEAIGLTGLQVAGAYQATRLDAIDPDDNMFLAAAYESQATHLVSLDKRHLLSLKHYHGTQIVAPALFVRVLSRP
jgi:putative PIN family toxin of toxin-antitoxin system